MKTQNQNIIIRFISPVGFNRITVQPDTLLSEVKAEAAKIIDCVAKDVELGVDGRKITDPDNTPVKRIKLLSHGVKVEIKSKTGAKAGLKQSKPVTTGGDMKMTEKGESEMKETKEKKMDAATAAFLNKAKVNSKCTHGPMGMCVHCMTPDDPDAKKEEAKNSTSKEVDLGPIDYKKYCQHGPNGKCLNCMHGGIRETKHIAFDNY